VPTVAEVGLPGYEMGAWQGVMAPAGTPSRIVARLAGELLAGFDASEGRRRLKALSLMPLP
jgi:tripartite-type tricarboxylate transporter receptor subunit TctC